MIDAIEDKFNKFRQKADSFCVSSGISFDFFFTWASDYVHKMHTILQNRSEKTKDTPSRFFEHHLFAFCFARGGI